MSLFATHTTTQTYTNKTILDAMVSVEKHCQAVAQNTINMDIEDPPGCTDSGVYRVNYDIDQSALSTADCRQSSQYQALLKAALSKTYVPPQQTAKPQSAFAMMAPIAIGRMAAGPAGAAMGMGMEVANNLISSNTLVNTDTNINVSNTLQQSSHYDDLEQCRSEASNVLNYTIKHCGSLVDSSILRQQAETHLLNCIQSSSSATNMSTGVDVLRKPVGNDNLTSTSGNTMVTLGAVILLGIIMYLIYRVGSRVFKN